jgi:hypothetical protein
VLGAVDQVGARALLLRQLAQAVGIGTVDRTHHQHQVAIGGQLAHRVLPVLRRVADVVVARALQRRESAAASVAITSRVSSTDSVVCVVKARLSGCDTCSASASSTSSTR